MNKQQFRLLVLVVFLAGLMGGALSERLFSRNLALAAKASAPASKAAAPAPKIVTAQEYRLQDAKGKTQLRIGFNAQGLATVYWNYLGQDPGLRGKEQSVVIGVIGFPQSPQ